MTYLSFCFPPTSHTDVYEMSMKREKKLLAGECFTHKSKGILVYYM